VTARRRTAVVLMAAALLVTAGCTGTFTPGTPLTLLVVDGGPGATSNVLAYAVDPPGPATPRAVRALGVGTVTPEIDGPVVALDWLDRDETGTVPPAGRRIVAMLVSERTVARGARAARLFAYDTSPFDVEAPAPLDPYAPLTFPLVEDGVVVLPFAAGVLAPDPGVCLSALSVSRTGRYLALLDARSACDPSAPADQNVLLLVDTQPPMPNPVPVVVLSTVAAPVRAVAPTIDQAADRVEYVTETVGTVVRRVGLADRSVVDTSPTLPGVGTFDSVDAFARYGSDRLVVAAGRLFQLDAAFEVGPAVTTRPAVARIVETVPGMPVVLITASGLVVHATPADDDEAFLAGPYGDGVTDLPDVMTYLVRPGAIDSLDLLLYDPLALNPIGTARTTYAAPEITAPRAITYFRPRPAGP
jgi:hypothetical protein